MCEKKKTDIAEQVPCNCTIDCSECCSCDHDHGIKDIKHIHVDNHDECSCCSESEHSGCSCGCHDDDDHVHAEHISCSCGCSHEEEMPPVSKLLLSVGILFLVCAIITSLTAFKYISGILYIFSYICIGYETFKTLIGSFRERDFFGETTLMTISSVGAMIIGEMIEGCMVMLLFRLGEMLEHKAMERSEDNIKRLLEMSPKIAERISSDGTIEKVSPKSLQVGDTVLVKAGGTIPCDGEVMEGCSNTDTSSITGESVPTVSEQGSSVRCGYISLDGTLKIRVTTSYEDNSFSKILAILSDNNKKRSKSEKFIARFARVYTPIVIVMAAVVMLSGSVITGEVSSWIYKGLVFLATSCPCAFVISVPLTFYFGIGECAKNGLLVKGSEFIEKTSKMAVVAFDKTGTLTKGEPAITSVITSFGYDTETVISICASLEKNSNHPIASKIVKYAEEHSIPYSEAEDIREIPGEGVCGIVSGKKIRCGNFRTLKDKNIFKTSDNTTNVYVVVEDTPIGVIQLSDTIRPEAPSVIKDLSKLGIKRILMLTGDNTGAAGQTAAECGITEIHSRLEPHEKSDIIKKTKLEASAGVTAFIGDGINDAPVLSASDVGIAMGTNGSDISVETADAVILGSSLEALTKGIKCTRRIMSRVKFNIAFALIVKAAILVLALFDIANMWIAVFGDVGVTIIVILNALRRIKIK